MNCKVTIYIFTFYFGVNETFLYISNLKHEKQFPKEFKLVFLSKKNNLNRILD